jgi:hypothetical protein
MMFSPYMVSEHPKASVAGDATALQVWSTILIAMVTVQQRSVLHWYKVHRSSNKDRVIGSKADRHRHTNGPVGRLVFLETGIISLLKHLSHTLPAQATNFAPEFRGRLPYVHLPLTGERNSETPCSSKYFIFCTFHVFYFIIYQVPTTCTY